MMRYFFELLGGGGLIQSAVALLIFAFQIWMFVDALRRREFLWAFIIFIGYGLSAILYYFIVYRNAAPVGNPLSGFELPGAADRRQIKSLQASIHHLDKPHHHLQLGDIYFNQGKLDRAEECYRAAYARDSQDEDIRAHLGTCLVRRGKAQEALPLLESVGAQNPKHDYGYTLMTLAETQTACGRKDQALATWQQVLGLYGYARARVQYAQLLVERQDFLQARKILQEVVADEPYEPRFQRKREAVWLRRAKDLLKSIPG
jgi:tetratricopeptide (TPR) repeat protein